MNKLAFFVLAVAACGGGDSNPGNTLGNCKLTLSGAVSGTFGCVATAGTQSGGTSVLGVVATESSGLKSFAYSVQVAGDPMTKTYTTTDFQVAGVVLQTTDNKTYLAATGGSPVGTVGSLTVSDLTFVSMEGTTKIYTMKGSTSGTVKNAQGADTISFTATF
jgi:hypothetical protein